MPGPLTTIAGAVLVELLEHPEVETLTIAKGPPVLIGVKRAGRGTAWSSGPGGALQAALLQARSLVMAPPAKPEVEP